MLKLFVSMQQTALGATEALRHEEGQTMAEYGVILAVVALAVLAAMTLLSGNITSALTSVANVLPH